MISVKLQLIEQTRFIDVLSSLFCVMYMRKKSIYRLCVLYHNGSYRVHVSSLRFRELAWHMKDRRLVCGGTKTLWTFIMCCRNFTFCRYLCGHSEHAKCLCPPHSNLKCLIRLCFNWYDLLHWWQVNPLLVELLLSSKLYFVPRDVFASHMFPSGCSAKRNQK